MKTLESGQDKIQKICNVLREETLEPAQKQAQSIIENAKIEAEKIIAEAKSYANKIHLEAKAAIEQEKNVFQGSLEQASRQSLEALRQSIEKNFFNVQLSKVIQANGADPKLVASLINAIAKSLEKDGLNANLTVLIPNTIEPRQVNELLIQEALKGLKEGSVIAGTFAAGAQIKIKEKNLTIDISEGALKELLSNYVVRKDFRKMIFDIKEA